MLSFSSFFFKLSVNLAQQVFRSYGPLSLLSVIKHSHLYVVEVDLHQVRIVPLYPCQRFLDVSGVGLLVWDWFVLGTLDNTWEAT